MREIVVNGGKCLCGEIDIQGSKNAALPILAAALLTDKECIIHNCPIISDTKTAIEILKGLGVKVKSEGNTVCVKADSVTSNVIPKQLMEKIRSSVMFLGAVLARCGEAVICSPGGCRLGSRPIDLHIDALSRLGAKIEDAGECMVCRLGKVKSEDICLLYPSVGATENIMLMCAVSNCSVRIFNGAREPEIVDLQNFLNLLGARICGAGSDCIVIRPSSDRCGAEYSVMTDRIAAATYACTAVACGGDVCLKKAEAEHMKLPLEVIKLMGGEVTEECGGIRVSAFGRPRGILGVKTLPYPGFPTDVQPMLTAALASSDGVTRLCETVFDKRFAYVEELNKMGAEIEISGNEIEIKGVRYLHGANVEAKDLRGGAALVTAAVSAEGVTVISGAEYISRGYEDIERDLRSLGADVLRI